jgi:hypothetical protein
MSRVHALARALAPAAPRLPAPLGAQERIKTSRLEQELQLRAARADELEELHTALDAERHAKRLLEDENKQLVERALSEADSTELGAIRRELADKSRVVSKLHAGVKGAEAELTDATERARSAELAAANLRAELAVVNRGRERLLADVASERSLAARYQEQLALYSGDAGVSPEELMRALALVREAGQPPKPPPPAQSDDARAAAARAAAAADILSTDEDALLRSLPPAQRRHVQEVLVANSELTLSLQKNEHLLSLAQGMIVTLREEIEIARAERAADGSARARQLDAQDAELGELRRELAMRPGGENVAAGRAPYRGGGRLPAGRAPPGSPRGGASTISEGESPELNVREDENLFELHVLAAELSRDWFPGGAPRTFVTVDFFDHETQTTALADGHAAIYDLVAQYIVRADDALLHYLRTHSLVLEMRQARATDEALVARATVPLSTLLSPAYERGSGGGVGIVGGGSGGRVKHTAALISADGLGHTVGSLRLTLRMRRPLDSVLVPFYRRFPELTTPPTAIAPRELTVSVLGARGLRAGGGGGAPLAPYVFYSLYDFGDYETPTGRGAAPSFASSHTFVIDVRARRLKEVMRAPVRFTVLDDDDSVTARTDEPLGARARGGGRAGHAGERCARAQSLIACARAHVRLTSFAVPSLPLTVAQALWMWT